MEDYGYNYETGEQQSSSSNDDQKNKKKRDLMAKIILVSFSFFLVSVMFLWSKSLNKNIKQPFSPDGSLESISAVGNKDLSKVDTDKDGLSDYDEANIYGTSPYLEDTDGDGHKDGDEILAGTDPNCPVGVKCNKSAIPEDTTKATDTGAEVSSPSTQAPSGTIGVPDTSSVVDDGPFLDRGVSTATEPGTTTIKATSTDMKSDNTTDIGRQVLGGQADPKVLRQLLQEAGGLSKAQLDQISDEDLLRTYKEVLTQPVGAK